MDTFLLLPNGVQKSEFIDINNVPTPLCAKRVDHQLPVQVLSKTNLDFYFMLQPHYFGFGNCVDKFGH